MKKVILLNLGCVLLAACSGDKTTQTNQTAKTVDYSQLKATVQSDARLASSAADTTENHVKNGLRLQLSQSRLYPTGGVRTDAVPAPATDSAGAGGSFSQTNVHVSGVDEADVAKYDGQYWYWAGNSQQGMRIFNAGANFADAKLLSELAAQTKTASSSLYLQQNQGKTQYAVSLSTEYSTIAPMWLPAVDMPMARPAVGVAAIDIALPIMYRPQNGKLIIAWTDVSSPANPAVAEQLTLQGQLMNSRKIGDVLYVFTRFDPWLEELKPAELNSEQQKANETLLQKTPLSDLMPKYHFGEQADKPLTQNCLLPTGVTTQQGFPSLVHITAVNLKTKTLVGSTCINAPMQNFTMNQNHAFLIAHAPSTIGASKTLIHQFTLGENGATYSATGSVPGSINGDLSFWLNEHNGVVRVLSSEFNNQDYDHRITLLKEQNGALVSVAQLPNGQHPEKIGKPGEQIYGARFVGDRAYVVTFRRTDPLYVVDLKTPTDPQIIGELEVPGFATYLHPVGDNYLFSLGQNADDTGRVTGIKTELIDVTDPAKPSSVRALFFGANASSAEALYDLHAVAVLPQTNGDMRFAFAINNFNQNYQWQYTGVHLFSVSGVASAQAKLTLDGVMVTESPSSEKTYPQYYGNGRTVLHDNAVYYGTGGTIWASTWTVPNNIKGPIPSKNTTEPGFLGCPTVLLDGVKVQISTASPDACSARVEAQSDNFSELLKPEPGQSSTATSCTFRGLTERTGYYTVRASAGTLPAQTQTVVLAKGRCNVMTQNLTFKF